jgi:hypothetical protein
MAIAERKPVASPSVQEGPRAKSLRPYERSRSVRPVTREVLAAFEAAVLSGDDLRIRVAAGRAMDELVVEASQGALPEELAAEIEREDEGEFRGTRADLELANYALAGILGSNVRTGVAAEDDDLVDDT